MKKKKEFEKNFKANWRNLYFIFVAVWCIDFLTTIIALNLPRYAGKLYEVNPLSAWFYSFGFIGWIFAFIYSLITLFLVTTGVCWLLNNKIRTDNFRYNLYLAVMFLFIFLEGNAIFNNFNLLITTS